MCHPAWAPAHAPAPYPRDLERVRRLRDLLDRSAHDAAWRLPLDVASLASREGIRTHQLDDEFSRAYGMSPAEYLAARSGVSVLAAPSPV